jgi:anti-anti-sigma regulatory factor
MAQNNAGEPDDAEAPATVVLPQDVGYVAAKALHTELLAIRDRSQVVFDAAAVQRLSTAAVLVVISFLNARAEASPPAAVVNPSGAFVDAFSELGLFRSLMRMEFRT